MGRKRLEESIVERSAFHGYDPLLNLINYVLNAAGINSDANNLHEKNLRSATIDLYKGILGIIGGANVFWSFQMPEQVTSKKQFVNDIINYSRLSFQLDPTVEISSFNSDTYKELKDFVANFYDKYI